jgi:hypothetical protein
VSLFLKTFQTNFIFSDSSLLSEEDLVLPVDERDCVDQVTAQMHAMGLPVAFAGESGPYATETITTVKRDKKAKRKANKTSRSALVEPFAKADDDELAQKRVDELLTKVDVLLCKTGFV